MDDRKYILSREAGLYIPLTDADRLLSAADGTAALLYLYMLRTGEALDIDAAAAALKRTAQEIQSAVTLLRGMGLLAAPNTQGRLLPADELPEYSAEEVVLRTENDASFKAVLAETQRIFGKMLTGSELKTLFGIYDYLAMPAEVVLVLINHCVEQYRSRTGTGRLPSMRSIEKEAYAWANREIITLERAEEFIRRKAERTSLFNRLRRSLGITDREPSAGERRYMEGWLDLGFPLESIELAYDRTVSNTGKLSWKYMDAILKSWHEKKLHSLEEIEAGDGRTKKRAPAAMAETAPNRGELERMNKLRDKIRSQE